MNTPTPPEPDAFERYLRRVPLRPPPKAWRGQVLEAAALAATTTTSESSRPCLADWLQDLLWPSPYAWAGIAAAWVTILTISLLAAPDPTSSLAGRTPSGSAAFGSFSFIAHRTQLAELLEIEVSPPAPPGPATTHGPRSAIANTNHTA